MRGLFLRGKIWWISYRGIYGHVRESTKTSDKNAALRILEIKKEIVKSFEQNTTNIIINSKSLRIKLLKKHRSKELKSLQNNIAMIAQELYEQGLEKLYRTIPEGANDNYFERLLRRGHGYRTAIKSKNIPKQLIKMHKHQILLKRALKSQRLT